MADQSALFDADDFRISGYCEVCERYWRYCVCELERPPDVTWRGFQTVLPNPRYL